MKSKIIGDALGNIIAIIITDHITNTIRAYSVLQMPRVIIMSDICILLPDEIASVGIDIPAPEIM